MRTLVFAATIFVACRSHHSPDDASTPILSPSEKDLTEVVVEVDTTRLAAYGLTLADVEHALLAMHLSVDAREPSSFVVGVRGPTPTMVLEIVIKVRDGVPVRLSDVARISTSAPTMREPDLSGGAPR